MGPLVPEVRMAVEQGVSARRIRKEIFDGFQKLFGSAPIRLMSQTVNAMRSRGYDDLASAIGDLDWQTVPADDPEDPTLRADWQELLDGAFAEVDSWMGGLGDRPLGYNLDSVGYPEVTGAWGALWSRQLGISFENRPGQIPEVFMFHGANQAIQASLIGVAEERRNRLGDHSPATVLVPIPTFSCPMDQIALHGMRAVLLPPSDPGMDPSAEDLQLVSEGVDVDGAYLMPINNPTGRTMPPERLRDFVDTVLQRWPHAGIILDSVYLRLHPAYRELLSWYRDDPRYGDSVLIVDSMSKTHGVTGLRSGAVLTRAATVGGGILRCAQNIMAGPSCAMQAVVLALLAPFTSSDDELADQRIELQLRIGRHLQRRRKLLLEKIFTEYGSLLHEDQPLLPDPDGFDWEGSMYADLQLSERCHEIAASWGVSPTVAFYLETGVGGVPLDGFCRNLNLERHGLVANADLPELKSYLEYTTRFVRLSFGMTPPPKVGL
jgi:aspartate/methionine/tyrosine aminotransferase